jgi:peptidyl-Lys metalloendopeptidase
MSGGKRNFAFVFILLIALLGTTVAGAAPGRGPTVTVSVSRGDFASTQDVLVTVTLSNTTEHTVRILKWFTPVYGVEEPLFAVTRDGQPVSYTGAIYKRPNATGRDYISLRAGQSLTSVVNLGDYYDLSQSGKYVVSYSVAAYNLFNARGTAFGHQEVLASGPADFMAAGREARARRTPPPPPPPGGNAFNACTTDQQSDLVNARAQATSYSTESRSYLGSHNSGTPRYVEWFGVFTSSRYTTVTTHFTEIRDAFVDAGITFDCKCKQPYYAYVYPDQPYVIHVCKYFWLAPLAGTDSRGGTLIHEMSHFTVVAGTDDFVYGQDGARNLADDNPDDAIMNADNHEYFAENTPFLP